MLEPVEDIEIRYWNKLRKDNASSLAWLYNRYFKLLYNYGRKTGAEQKSVEDAIHDLFVDLWRFRKGLSPTTSVRFYLYRSLRRRLVRNNNEKKYFIENHARIIEDLLQTVPSEEQDIINTEIQHHRVSYLKKLLDNLSPRQYEAMILKFYDELSFEEIGAILDVNEQSARNLVQRGLTQLKEYSKLLLGCATPMMADPGWVSQSWIFFVVS
jgi:RNA polymerase sigma factor (sigma-70 family)